MNRCSIIAIVLVLAQGLVLAAPPVEPERGDFLVAARHLEDPNFAESVVLMIEHSSVGSLGVIVNRPTGIPLSDAVEALAAYADQDHKLYFGGPVSREAVNYLTREAPSGESLKVTEHVFLGGSRGGLRSLLERTVAKDGLRVYGGYAGWAAGQLQAELARDDWYVVRGRAEQVFAANPHRVWPELIDRLDPRGLITDARGRGWRAACDSAPGCVTLARRLR